MKRKDNYNIIGFDGLNLPSFVNLCTSSEMTLHSLEKQEGKDGESSRYVEFGISSRDLKTLKSLDTSRYQWRLVREGGFRRVLNFLICRLGVVMGLVVSIVAILFFNNRLLNIRVMGLTSISSEEVVESIHKFGLGTLSSLDFDREKLQDYLMDRFNFSLVSIVTRGSSLVVNVKEELPELKSKYIPITADFNMIISAIDVWAGTSTLKSGDVVFKGDTLVEPYIISDGEKVYVTPKAKITATLYFSAKIVYKTEEEVYVKTGKYQKLSSGVYLGMFQLSNSTYDCKFSEYEVEEHDLNISQYFLPIHMKKVYAYELEKKTVSRDFDIEKDRVIEKTKKQAYGSVPERFPIVSEEVGISRIDDGYIVSVYLESKYTFNYNNN